MGLALGGGEAGEKESLTCALFRTATGHGRHCSLRCLESDFETTRALCRELGARKGREAFKSAAGGERGEWL